MIGESTVSDGMKVIFGFAGISSTSANFTTAFEQDNQFTFTLIGAPQSEAAEIDLDNFVFLSAKGSGDTANPKSPIYKSNAPTMLASGMIGQIFKGHTFKIPAKTSMIEDYIQ
jgi:hypothetical protein